MRATGIHKASKSSRRQAEKRGRDTKERGVDGNGTRTGNCFEGTAAERSFPLDTVSAFFYHALSLSLFLEYLDLC